MGLYWLLLDLSNIYPFTGGDSLKSTLFSYESVPIFLFQELVCIIYSKLEGLAPYGCQTSSSCGGLVAFDHQMGALQAPWLVKLQFGALHFPPSSSFEGLVAFGHQMGALQAPWHVKLKLEALCVPPSCDPKKSQEKDSNIMNVWT